MAIFGSFILDCSPKTSVSGVFWLLEFGGSNLNPKSPWWNNLWEGWLFQPLQNTAIGIPVVCLSGSRASYWEHHPALGSSRKTKHITSTLIPTHVTANSFLFFQPRFFSRLDDTPWNLEPKEWCIRRLFPHCMRWTFPALQSPAIDWYRFQSWQWTLKMLSVFSSCSSFSWFQQKRQQMPPFSIVKVASVIF